MFVSAVGFDAFVVRADVLVAEPVDGHTEGVADGSAEESAENAVGVEHDGAVGRRRADGG